MSDEDRIFQVLGELKEMKGSLNEFKKHTNQQLRDIKTTLERGNKAFEDIRLNCVREEGRIDALEESNKGHNSRINSLEKDGLPQKTKWKIDGSLFLGIINGIITIIKSWMGLP